MAKKQIVKLTEGDLHRIIKESVNNVLKESNYTDNDITYGMWNNIVEQLGAEQVLSMIVKYASSDQLKQWIQWIQEELDMDSDLDDEEWQ